ncbi:MAG TPA: hypothetical protein VN673_03120, partial [Clostridia bacterium]|nr:hypothetical protein [Clostridia bacterium]
LTAVVKPGDTTQFPTTEYDYVLAHSLGGTGIVNYIETRQLDRSPDSGGGPKQLFYYLSRQFVDGLGRELLSKHEAEPATPGGPPRAIISGATLFNSRQGPATQVNPCFSLLSGAGLDQVLGFEDISRPGWRGLFGQGDNLAVLDLAGCHKTGSRYDALLRPLFSTNQDGTFERTVYEPLITRSYDANQTAATPHAGAGLAHHHDGLGRLVRVDEIVKINDDGTASSTTNLWTTIYVYDVNDRLVRITDSQNNRKDISYDGLLRKTFMNDPDRGTMSYTYDNASNLKETVDARGQQILYTYDGANRLLTETYVASALSPRLGEDRGEGPVNVAYHYDTPSGMVDQGDGTQGVAQNAKGMLAFVSDGSGEEHVSYDARGRISFVVKRIPDPELLESNLPPASVLVAYRTAFEYDSLDRLTRLVYPDSDEVHYQYNERTLLSRIVGGPSGSILSNLVYWPSDQQREMTYGNGVRTTHAYDDRLRLEKLVTAPAQSPNAPLISFRYTFDPGSNIRAIADERPESLIPPADPRRNNQEFDYDDVYRLIATRYSFAAPGGPARNDGQIHYRYDRIGNLRSQLSNIEHYESGLSVTQLGDVSYGGAAGASGRTGRPPGDPPGPHAMTSVSQTATNTPGPRTFPYDANGNMTLIDGMVCTWDFKDRLVRVEGPSMQAQYTYDYTDRRITKKVISKGLSQAGPAGQ